MKKWNVAFNLASPRWMDNFIFNLMKIFFHCTHKHSVFVYYYNVRALWEISSNYTCHVPWKFVNIRDCCNFCFTLIHFYQKIARSNVACTINKSIRDFCWPNRKVLPLHMRRTKKRSLSWLVKSPWLPPRNRCVWYTDFNRCSYVCRAVKYCRCCSVNYKTRA